MKRFLTFCCALLGFGAMAMAETTTQVTLLEDQSKETTKATSVALSDNETFWNLFEKQDESLALTVVVDNSGCFSETGYANVGFGGNYTGSLKGAVGGQTTTVWLSAEGAGTVSGTIIETYTFSVADIITLFSAGATQSWDLGATIWVDGQNKSAWGGSYGEYPGVTTVEPYLDNEFALENLSSLQVQVNNSSVLVSVSYSYSYVDAEPEGSTNKTWRFDDTDWTEWQGIGYTVSGVEEKNGLIFYAGSDSKVVYQNQGGTCMIGADDNGDPITETYANRVQLGGAGVFDLTTTEEEVEGVTTTKYAGKTLLGVPVDGPCKISVVAMASGENNERRLKASAVDVTGVTTDLNPTDGYLTSNSSDVNALFTFEYEGDDEAVVYLYSSNSAINIFEITVEEIDESEGGEETEIEGYLTVSVGGEEVGDVNQEVTITVTENNDETITVELGDLTVSIATIANASVTFTPNDETGEYTNGVVSGNISGSGISADATGSYVVADGETSFTASFSYTVPSIGDLAIAVSFTTVEPVAEPEYGWTLITDEFDAEQYASSNNCITLAWADLTNYTQIAIVAYTSSDYNDWGCIQVDQSWNGLGNWTTTTGAEYQYIVYDLATLQAEVDAKATTTTEVFYITFWDNTTAAAVYGYGEISEDTGTEGGGSQGEVVDLPKAGDSFIDRFANQTGIWGGDDYTSDVVDGKVTWTTAGSWSGIGAWFNSGVDDDVAGLSIKMIAGGTGKVKAYVQWTGDCVSGSDVEVEATTATDEITLTIVFDKESADKYENADFRQVCVQFEGVTTSEAIFTEAVLLGATETAIADVKSDVEAVEVARYNLMGQKLSGAEKGINIIVYSDGTAKKVLVK